VRYLIAPVFGLMRADGKRVIRTFWFEIPRKNGKSTICSGLALYLLMADREPAAEVYAAAGSRSQAGIVFRAARSMALGSTEILKRLTKKGIQRGLLEHPATGSIFRALASGGELSHGLNVHGAIIDELHVHKNPDVVDALETGTGSREQPLVGIITTADAGKDGSVYATKREYVEGLVAGTVVDETYWAVIFAIDDKVEGFDPFSDETLGAANPGAGWTVTWDYLHAQANVARQSPAQLNRYLRLHLNIRTKQLTRWIPLDRYDATGQLIDDAEWKGKVVTGGLDLSTSADLTAFAIFGRDDERGHRVRVMHWLPEERIDELERLTKMPLKRWVKEGWLRSTEGNVVDYAQVRADIIAERDKLGITFESVAYDPWNASETVTALQDDGFNMVPVRQGYANLSPPTKALERMILGSTPDKPMIRTGGNPILRWEADCVEVRTDDNGNIKPVKPDRGKSAKRIDGIVAAIMAVREDMATEEVSPADAYMADLMARQAAAQAAAR
jgi:phage terminase large subunit-like protein